MPIHDWTRVDAGLFHDFHQSWTVTLCNALNDGCLPADHFSLVEQSPRAPVADFLTMQLSSEEYAPNTGSKPLSVRTVPPRTRLVRRSQAIRYAEYANRIVVRNRFGDVVALIEIVSPGQKLSGAEFRTFVQKSSDLVRQGIHLLVIDLFPPGRNDPQGIHKAIWDQFEEEDLELPPDKPLIVASYEARPDYVAYVEPIGVGDPMPSMPLFLEEGTYVLAPLEASYQATWETFPAPMKRLLETPARKSP